MNLLGLVCDPVQGLVEIPLRLSQRHRRGRGVYFRRSGAGRRPFAPDSRRDHRDPHGSGGAVLSRNPFGKPVKAVVPPAPSVNKYGRAANGGRGEAAAPIRAAPRGRVGRMCFAHAPKPPAIGGPAFGRPPGGSRAAGSHGAAKPRHGNRRPAPQKGMWPAGHMPFFAAQQPPGLRPGGCLVVYEIRPPGSWSQRRIPRYGRLHG